MFKLFVILNIRLWWRSLKGAEIGAILFYSLFLILILGQFIGIAIVLLFSSEVDAVQEAYPWYTADVQLMVNLLFVNMLWLTQLFFTKIGRLRINDNRKLLALGLPVSKLTRYLNLAGFFHPVNLLFNLIWFFYLGLLSSTLFQFLGIILLILVNYGVINSFKWRFKLFADENLKWINGFLFIGLMVIIFVSFVLDINELFSEPQQLAAIVNRWLIYSPGMIFYWIPSISSGQFLVWFALSVFVVLIVLFTKDLHEHTRKALRTPAAYVSANENSQSVSIFIKWLGKQGGKFFYVVWSHPYSKTQFILTYLLVMPYIFFMNDGSAVGSYMVAVFLTLIPILFLMVMLSNLFGFENRELLLSLQAPVSHHTIIKERFISAFKITLLSLITVIMVIPILFTEWLTMLQVFLGILFITMVFLHYVLDSCVENYKKIEHVSLMSVSNPIVPASVTFTSMFMTMILGIATFIFYDSMQWLHVTLILIGTILLGFWFTKKFARISTSFRTKVIPQLWNEL